MTEQEEFEFRLRLENEQSALVKAEEVPFIFSGMYDEPKSPSMSQYLLNRAQMGLTNIPLFLVVLVLFMALPLTLQAVSLQLSFLHKEQHNKGWMRFAGVWVSIQIYAPQLNYKED